jgi:hypothetical protein
VTTQPDLWPGIDLKLEYARFHFGGMSGALRPPEPRRQIAVQGSIDGDSFRDWHLKFYAHFDAFLSAARSVPEIIRCCFGKDTANRLMRDWFDGLDPSERSRREEFGKRFTSNYKAFRNLPLGMARHISEHRTGVPPVTVTINGRFGLTYIGDPLTRVPTSEMRPVQEDDQFGWLARPMTVHPMWQNFDTDGRPLFETCETYLDSARSLIGGARKLAEVVHGDNPLSPPPS